MILVPPKIKWMVDLTQDETKLWREKALKRVQSPHYNDGLSWSIEDPSKLSALFLPIYTEHVMNRNTFRLDKAETLQKLETIAHNPDYQLFLMRTKPEEIILGGVVFHKLPGMSGIAYRVYDHELAKSLGFQKIDYYAEKCFQGYVRSLGCQWLSHGSDRHPISQPGLSLFKLSVGARPIVYLGDMEQIPQEINVEDWNQKYETWGFYSEPTGLGYYQKLNIYGECDSDCVLALVKVARGVGLTVECNSI